MDYVKEYLSHLKHEIKQREIAPGVVEITTPFLDRFNDYTQIYIQEGIGQFRISDDGYILNNLEMQGIYIDSSPHKEKILRSILNRFGLRMDTRTKEIYATESIPSKVMLAFHRVLQGMLDIDDMFYLVTPTATDFFSDKVTQFFKQHKVYNTKNVSFMGRSGYMHTYDFLLQENEKHPGRVVRLMNKPEKATFERFAFSWEDIREKVAADGDIKKCIILINDASRENSANVKNISAGFTAYGIESALWSQREEQLPLFH